MMRPARVRWSLGVTFACALAGAPVRAHAADVCAAERGVDVRGRSRDAILAEARGAAITGERAHARALYLAVLAMHADDLEAVVGLARVDAWDHCWVLAERGYRSALSRAPADAEARAGLVDLLLWQGRLHEADDEVSEGLSLSPRSPELLARRARLAHWRGDEEAALRDASAAVALSPLDPVFRADREQLFLGEARVGARAQALPRGYDDVVTADTEVMQRYHRLRFHVGHRLVARTGAFGATTPIDGRRAFGVYHHFTAGGWAGLELAHTSPAAALPRWAMTVSALAPLGGRFSFFLSAAYWRYAADKSVFLIAPSVGVSLTDSFEVGLRWWVSSVATTVPGQAVASDTVHSVGVRAMWRPEPTVLIGAEYTYGVQLDQNPTLAQLLQLRSHVLTVFARRMFTPHVGVQPVLAVERRESVASGAVIVVPAV
jgi:YaiO family outer membrane protein